MLQAGEAQGLKTGKRHVQGVLLQIIHQQENCFPVSNRLAICMWHGDSSALIFPGPTAENCPSEKK